MKISKVCAMRHKIESELACNITPEMDSAIYTKALRVCLGSITLADAVTAIINRFDLTPKMPKQRIWIDSNAANNIGCHVASNSNDTGLGGSWFTRTVTFTGYNDYAEKTGYITVNKQQVKVLHDSVNEWNVA